MFNLLSGELYKLRKSKTFLVCCVIIGITIFLLSCLVKFADQIDTEKLKEEQGIYLNVSEEPLETGEITLLMAEQMLKAYIFVFLLAFSSAFIVGDYKNGAIKNIVGKGYGRGKIFLAKYIVTMLGVLLMIAVTVVLIIIGGAAFWGMDTLNGEMLKNLCKFVGIESLIALGCTGIWVVISEYTRNQGTAFAGSIGLQLGFTLVLPFLDKIFDKAMPSKYVIIKLMTEVPVTDMDREFVVRVIIIAVSWIVACGFIGMEHFKRADIK